MLLSALSGGARVTTRQRWCKIRGSGAQMMNASELYCVCVRV